MNQEKEALKVINRNTSVLSGVFNLSKAAIGLGILAMPNTFNQSGYINGIFLLILGAAASTGSLHFLSRIAANTDIADYFELGRAAYGPFGETTAVVSLILFLYGTLIAYTGCIGQFFSEVAVYFLGVTKATAPFYAQVWFMIIVAGLLISPLAVMRDVSALAKTSLLGMACMTMVLVLTVADYFIDTTPATIINYPTAKFDGGLFRSLSSIIFAFCNHFTMLKTVPSLINPTVRRRQALLFVSMFIITSFYMLAAVFGFLHFGDAVPEMIINARVTTAYVLAKLAVGIVIVCSYPLLSEPTKTSIMALVEKCLGKTSGAADSVRNLVVSLFLVSSTAFFAIFIQDFIVPVINVFSSATGAFLVFIFPSLYFLKLSKTYQVYGWERIVAYLIIALGLSIFFIGTYFNSIDCYYGLKKYFEKSVIVGK